MGAAEGATVRVGLSVVGERDGESPLAARK